MHRQIIHTEGFIGQPKVRSAAAACRSINSIIQVVECQEALRTSNALKIMSSYDIIVDTTDNAPSRYMISDCCVVLGKPRVSGAALGFEGQVKIRRRSLQCVACGENTTFSKQQFRVDYENFTQSPLSSSLLKLNIPQPDSRINTKEYKEKIVNGEAHILIDVCPEQHFKIVSLPNSLNILLPSLEARLPEISLALKKKESSGPDPKLYVVCRRGNDSQRTVLSLHKLGFTLAKDIIGGLDAWAHDVDPN